MLTRVPLDGDVDAVTAEQRSLAVQRLDPRNGRMVDVVWLDAGADLPGRLILMLHHVVVDGVSLRLLSEDLASAWTDVQAGQPVSLATADTPLRQWADELRAATTGGTFAADEDYWLRGRRRRSRADDRQQAARPGGRRGRDRGQAGGARRR